MKKLKATITKYFDLSGLFSEAPRKPVQFCSEAYFTSGNFIVLGKIILRIKNYFLDPKEIVVLTEALNRARLLLLNDASHAGFGESYFFKGFLLPKIYGVVVDKFVYDSYLRKWFFFKDRIKKRIYALELVNFFTRRYFVWRKNFLNKLFLGSYWFLRRSIEKRFLRVHVDKKIFNIRVKELNMLEKAYLQDFTELCELYWNCEKKPYNRFSHYVSSERSFIWADAALHREIKKKISLPDAPFLFRVGFWLDVFFIRRRKSRVKKISIFKREYALFKIFFVKEKNIFREFFSNFFKQQYVAASPRSWLFTPRKEKKKLSWYIWFIKIKKVFSKLKWMLRKILMKFVTLFYWRIFYLRILRLFIRLRMRNYTFKQIVGFFWVSSVFFFRLVLILFNEKIIGNVRKFALWLLRIVNAYWMNLCVLIS